MLRHTAVADTIDCCPTAFLAGMKGQLLPPAQCAHVPVGRYPINTADPPPRPTTVMLSHVYPLKDIITAIRSAGIIVNTYHVTGEQVPRAQCVSSLHSTSCYCASRNRLTPPFRTCMAAYIKPVAREQYKYPICHLLLSLCRLSAAGVRVTHF